MFGITLWDQLKMYLEKRFRKFQCVKFQYSDGTGESCSASIDCRCGEYCFKNPRNPDSGTCRPAECSAPTVEQNSTVCQTYSDFNDK